MGRFMCEVFRNEWEVVPIHFQSVPLLMSLRKLVSLFLVKKIGGKVKSASLEGTTMFPGRVMGFGTISSHTQCSMW